MEPPSPVTTGSRSNACASAFLAASNSGPARSARHGLPPCRCVTVTVTPLGATFATCAFMSRSISLGSWSGTRRQLTFAMLTPGSTVFAPSPVQPLSRPFTSHVGRVQRRSSTVNPGSPKSDVTPTSSMKCWSSKDSVRICASTLSGKGRTAS